MKVLHINPGVRGVASYALNIYNYFSQNQPDVDTLVLSSSKWRKQQIPVYEPDSWLIGKILPWPKSVKKVMNKIDEYDPDIIHHHHPSGRLDLHLDKIQKRHDVPTICTIHMSIGSKKYFIDRVMHTFFVMSRKHFKNLTCYVAISEFVRKQIEEIGGLPKDRIVKLYAGVDPSIYKPLEYEKHDTLNITFVGQIMPEKGIDVLVDVVMDLAEERKVQLNIIGEGHLKKRLEKKSRNCSAINWVGYLNSPQKVAEYYATADVVVLPTRWDEAFSYIPLESMASGTPVIASRTGGNPEAIVEGETGHLFTLNNKQELYDILKKIDIERLWEMGANGRQRVIDKFTLDKFGEKYYSLYQNLLNDPSNLKQID